ncbi:hypothetical protein MIZ03_1915 [Rhodoferax lithotrophicus]|uniref:Uncharacterized protein n=1 Tax=Rhodoferax lithotrophicus TaxID=2798804 RepID=A0ABN6D645_9BURK|nr:hypothetical protein MIZ03_1915 [Rhodoferax sp. MIZ03]
MGVCHLFAPCKSWQVGGVGWGDIQAREGGENPGFNMLPCARITSIRFKGTFSVGSQFELRVNTPSECALDGARGGFYSASQAQARHLIGR